MSTKTTQDKPTPPKRPLTAYFIFMTENREKLRIKYADKSQAAFTKLMGETWRKLNDKERAMYEDRAKKAKAEYDKDLAAYVAKYGQPPKKTKKISTSGEKKKVKKTTKEEASESEDAAESEEEKEPSNPKLSKGKKQVQPKVPKK